MSHPTVVSVAVAWLVVLAVGLTGLVCIGEAKIKVGLADGEVDNCCAEHTEQVNHGPFEITGHIFYGSNMDAQNPENVICEPHAADESIRCPDACVNDPPAGTPRVRRAIHTLSSEQWQRVVNAMWVMRTTSTADGVAQYGNFYRSWDYFLLFHTMHGGSISGNDADVTGGASHFATWHGAHVLDFETSLLAVDPEIEALPYLDWEAMPVNSDRFNAYFGQPAQSVEEYLYDYYRPFGLTSPGTIPGEDWSVVSWGTTNAVSFGWSANNTGTRYGIVSTGPFAHWPISTGSMVRTPRDEAMLAKEAAVQAAKADGSVDYVEMWGDADGFLAELRASQPPGVFGNVPMPPFTLYKDYAADPNATQMRDSFLNAPVPYLVRYNATTTATGAVGNASAVKELYAQCVTNLGNYFADHVNCMQGRLKDQTNDLHDLWHTAVGGDNMGIGGPNDPTFWFHHAAVDKAWRHWAQRNRQLRSRAWGYFVKASFSNASLTKSHNSAPVDLNDIIGLPPNADSAGTPKLWDHSKTTPLFGVGFDLDRLMGRSDAGMDATVATPARNVDILCGDVETLYTYDVVAEEALAVQALEEVRRMARAVGWVALLLALLGVNLLLQPTRRVLTVALFHGSADGSCKAKMWPDESTEEWDLGANEAAKQAKEPEA